MINHLKHMAVFAKVVEEGSFRAAAKKLGLAPSRVSETVSDLEKYLGATLLYRTTRKHALTSEGRQFYVHVAALIKNAEAGLNELNAQSKEPIGDLKVSLPAFLASSAISTAISEFTNLHKKVSLSLSYTDRVVDMINAGLDLTIRVGWLEDSSMMSRKLGDSHRYLVASKDYVASRSKPKHPSDLKDWDWIRFDMRSTTIELTSASGEKATVAEKSRISVDSAEAVRHFCQQNLGLAILPEHTAEEGLRSGEFVHVLPNWKLKSMGYYAVWPDQSRRESLTLLLVRFLAEHQLNSTKPLKPLCSES